MSLTEEQEQSYRQTLEISRKQIEELNVQIEEELAKAKDRLADLQTRKNAARQIYDGACRILGIENDLGKPGDVAKQE
jgi:DNA repair exonuclease SbcCD ATPase subunit